MHYCVCSENVIGFLILLHAFLLNHEQIMLYTWLIFCEVQFVDVYLMWLIMNKIRDYIS